MADSTAGWPCAHAAMPSGRYAAPQLACAIRRADLSAATTAGRNSLAVRTNVSSPRMRSRIITTRSSRALGFRGAQSVRMPASAHYSAALLYYNTSLARLIHYLRLHAPPTCLAILGTPKPRERPRASIRLTPLLSSALRGVLLRLRNPLDLTSGASGFSWLRGVR